MRVEDWLGSDNKLGIDIWKKKYCNNNESFDEWLDRVSGGNEIIRRLILEKKFLFGGRILANRGISSSRKLSLSNCYVLSSPEDNLESIFECGQKLARTYSYGGGCGIDISKLAPRGAAVRNAAKESSGAVSFMDLYSMITGLISQNGRRGALMISMSCDHPDIEEFIDIKTDLDRVTKANISVRVSDEFMMAVENDEDFTLSYTRKETGECIEKTIKARELMKKLAYNNWDMGEPGILFWDRITNWNFLSEYDDFAYAGVNPCAEEPLPPGGSCCLGSINLSQYVNANGNFDFEAFDSDVVSIVAAMNDVLDDGLPLHPLDEQRRSVRDWRQIGVGIMGVADMLIKMGVRYGSDDAVDICESIACHLLNFAVLGSCNKAVENCMGFPKFDGKSSFKSPFFQENLFEPTKKAVKRCQMYNSQLLTIAPTGSLSTMLGISGGIEPIFAYSFNRKTESLHGEDKVYDQSPSVVKEYMMANDLNDFSQLPDYFVVAQDIDYHDRIKMQAIWQKYIDASISSTVNLPNEATPDDVFDLYMSAWKAGLKGITVFRDGCRRSAILTTSSSSSETEPTSESAEIIFNSIKPVSRKTMGTTHGDTYYKKCACGTLYITVNRDNDGNIVETFVSADKDGICKANVAAVNRLISLSLRSGVRVDEIIDQIKGIDCPACRNAKKGGREIDGMSCADIIARTILEFSNGETPPAVVRPRVKPKVEIIAPQQGVCPECGAVLSHTGGCVQCPECFWGKCEG